MDVKDQIVEVKWTAKQKKYYEEKGYIFTKFGESFFVKVSDLPEKSSKKVNVNCDYCGKTFTISYDKYYRTKHSINPKIACIDCAGEKYSESTSITRRKRLYENLKEVFDKNNYTLLTSEQEIWDSNSIIKYICPKHGIRETELNRLLKCHGCPECEDNYTEKKPPKQNTKTLEYKQKLLFEKATIACDKKGYTLLSNKEDIINNITVVKYLCPKHGEQSMRISNLISGRGCPKCAREASSKLYRLNSDEVEKRALSVGAIILNKNEYKNNTEKNLQVICPNCKNIFYTSLRNLTQHGGQVCNKCKTIESNGERKIRMFLEKHSIVFEQEKWFSDCRDINPLPFDFYLPDYNFIIEFDGRQHFEDTGIFHYSLEQTKKHDKIKNDYCNSNNINLLRISYLEYGDIDEILENKLIHMKI